MYLLKFRGRDPAHHPLCHLHPLSTPHRCDGQPFGIAALHAIACIC
jgi:hypothetical protein